MLYFKKTNIIEKFYKNSYIKFIFYLIYKYNI